MTRCLNQAERELGVALIGDEVDDAILSLGFDDYWYRKPFDIALFAERVRRLMAQGTNGRH